MNHSEARPLSIADINPASGKINDSQSPLMSEKVLTEAGINAPYIHGSSSLNPLETLARSAAGELADRGLSFWKDVSALAAERQAATAQETQTQTAETVPTPPESQVQTPEQTTPSEVPTRFITANEAVNVRKGTSTENAIWDRLTPGTHYRVLEEASGQNGLWYRIEFAVNGEPVDGWVYSGVVQIVVPEADGTGIPATPASPELPTGPAIAPTETTTEYLPVSDFVGEYPHLATAELLSVQTEVNIAGEMQTVKYRVLSNPQLFEDLGLPFFNLDQEALAPLLEQTIQKMLAKADQLPNENVQFLTGVLSGEADFINRMVSAPITDIDVVYIPTYKSTPQAEIPYINAYLSDGKDEEGLPILSSGYYIDRSNPNKLVIYLYPGRDIFWRDIALHYQQEIIGQTLVFYPLSIIWDGINNNIRADGHPTTESLELIDRQKHLAGEGPWTKFWKTAPTEVRELTPQVFSTVTPQ